MVALLTLENVLNCLFCLIAAPVREIVLLNVVDLAAPRTNMRGASSMKAYMNWSSGKDSALALYKTLQSKEYEVISLLTTVSGDNNRVSMHGVHADLLRQQANCLGLPLSIIAIPPSSDTRAYEDCMLQAMAPLKEAGAHYAIFGDIHLKDVKEYREEKLAKAQMKPVFPLWGLPTNELIEEFIDLGFKAVVTCVDAQKLGEDFVGRVIDRDFIASLPANVDICGENGEFHSFVFDGPLFKRPVDFKLGEKVYSEYTVGSAETYGYWYIDILLSGQ